MAEMLRIKLRWSGFVGGPGYSVFHIRDFDGGGGQTIEVAQAAVNRINASLTHLQPLLPSIIRLKLDSDVEVIEDTNGEMQNVFTVVSPAETAGTASGTASFAAAVGGVVNWRTGGVRNGRRIRGKTFIVPLSSTAFENDGTLSAGTLGSLGVWATQMRQTAQPGDLGVWARPSGPGATDGSWHVATSHSVPDMGAVLRSRRD